MISPFMTISGLRVWYVPEIQVWGTASRGSVDMLLVENVEGQRFVMYHSMDVEGTTQEICFTDLRDFRGNALPVELINPRVIVNTRSAYKAFLVGPISGESFRIARDDNAPSAVQVDLLVIEMGS